LTKWSNICYSGVRTFQMANNKDKQVREGVVIEAFPNTLFKVKTSDDQSEVLCFLSGKMRLHRIRVLIGDKVSFEVDEYGGKGKIIKRS
jgi:translation initiation factor IF-1